MGTSLLSWSTWGTRHCDTEDRHALASTHPQPAHRLQDAGVTLKSSCCRLRGVVVLVLHAGSMRVDGWGLKERFMFVMRGSALNYNLF